MAGLHHREQEWSNYRGTGQEQELPFESREQLGTSIEHLSTTSSVRRTV
jgi:hypothetical protein